MNTNPQELRKIFADTINPNTLVRNQAEEKLKQISKNIDVYICIQNNLIKDPDIMIRKSATIYFINKITEYYNCNEIKPFISQFEQTIFNYMLYANNESELEIAEKLMIVFYENTGEEQLTHLLQEILQYYCTNDMSKVFIVCQTLALIYKIQNFREPIKNFVNAFFDSVGDDFANKFQHLIQNKKWNIVRVIMKFIGKSYCEYELSEKLSNEQIFNFYINMAISICEQQCYDCEDFIKSKKWALFFLYKMSNKGIKNYFKKDSLSHIIKEPQIITKIINIFCKQIEEYKKTSFPCDMYIVYIAYFFETIGSSKYTKQYLSNVIEILLFDFIIPAYKYDEKTKLAFEYDYNVYLSERYNFTMNQKRGAISSLFCNIVRHNKSYETQIVQILIQNLNDPSINLEYKYGVLGLLGDITKSIRKVLGNEKFYIFINTSLKHWLFSDNLPLVSQSLYFMSLAEDIDMKQEDLIELIQVVFKYIQHENVILQIESCLAMNFFFYSENIVSYLNNVIPGLLNSILKFNKEYPLEALNNLMEQIVNNFGELIIDYAPQFVSIIIGNINEILSSEDNKNDGYYTVSSYLQSIDKLIVSSGDKLDITKSVYELVVPIIYRIFKEELFELFADGFELMNTFFYNLESIDSKAYEIFKIALSSNKDELALYSNEIQDFMDNFVSFGKENVINEEILKLYYDMFELFFVTPEDIYEDDYVAAFNIINALLLYCGNKVAQIKREFIPVIVSKIITKLNALEEESVVCMVYGLETIMNCIIIQLADSLFAMEHSKTLFFNKVWEYSPNFKRVIDKKIFLIFLKTIFMCKMDTTISIEELNKSLVMVLTSLPDAIKKRNALFDESDDNSDEISNTDYDMLTEDIYASTPLDSLNPYEMVSNMLKNIVPGTVGQESLRSMKVNQISAIKEILNHPQEVQKLE